LIAPSLKLDKWSTGQIVGCILGVAFGVVAVYAIFLLPFLYRRLELEDWTLKSWEVIKGPLLWKRGPVPPRPEGVSAQVVQDYYRGHKTKEELLHEIDAIPPASDDAEKQTKTPKAESGTASDSSDVEVHTAMHVPETNRSLKKVEESSFGPWYTPKNLLIKAKYYFFRGVDRDVVDEQLHGKKTMLTGDLNKVHMHTAHFDNKTEHLYSFLQVLTASVASFAHGSNDVSNAIGPLSAIFLIWNSGKLSSKSPVPVWVLAYGGAAIVIGLWTYGYNIMRNLGNRLTLHSPSRGFSMELGSAITVILATRLGLPISTTQCITGATVGVGLSSGTLRAINWRMVAWIYMGWIITLPIAGIIAGCLLGIIINAPTWSGLA
jgi:solute carrier family 20 (sodium-dependent phosphate transporter)